jgi:hypothetical protein
LASPTILLKFVSRHWDNSDLKLLTNGRGHSKILVELVVVLQNPFVMYKVSMVNPGNSHSAPFKQGKLEPAALKKYPLSTKQAIDDVAPPNAVIGLDSGHF